MTAKQEILIVEDSKSFALLLKSMIESKLGYKATVAYSLAEAEVVLQTKRKDFFIAILDYHLPDANEGEAIDFVLDKDLPGIIVTGSFDKNLPERALRSNIVDYFLKKDFSDPSLVLNAIRRQMTNKEVKILLVDDSGALRKYYKSMLGRFNYQILEASDGQEALKVLWENQDVKLVLTDYNMPGMDGFELISKIRALHKKETMGIIGLSSIDDKSLIAKSLKYGANDFMSKSFGLEELSLRVSQVLDNIGPISEIKESASRGYLTRLHNRLHFFSESGKALQKAVVRKRNLSLCLFDIDHFKKFNDTYGHDTGDDALKVVAKVINKHFEGSAITARYGGEEFCVLFDDKTADEAVELLEAFRVDLSETKFDANGTELSLTISLGLVTGLKDSVEELLTLADGCLYTAKEAGRNNLVSKLV